MKQIQFFIAGEWTNWFNGPVDTLNTANNLIQGSIAASKHGEIAGDASRWRIVEVPSITMNRQDRYDAIHILEDTLHSMGNATLGTWCVKGSAMHKLQSAIRYLAADLRDHAEQYDELNDAV